MWYGAAGEPKNARNSPKVLGTVLLRSFLGRPITYSIPVEVAKTKMVQVETKKIFINISPKNVRFKKSSKEEKQ